MPPTTPVTSKDGSLPSPSTSVGRLSGGREGVRDLLPHSLNFVLVPGQILEQETEVGLGSEPSFEVTGVVGGIRRKSNTRHEKACGPHREKKDLSCSGFNAP